MHVCWCMCATVCMWWSRIIFGSLFRHHINSRVGTHYVRCSKWLNCWAIFLPPNQKKGIYKNAYRNIKISLMEKLSLNKGDKLLLIIADRINCNAKQLLELNVVWSKRAWLCGRACTHANTANTHTHTNACTRVKGYTWEHNFSLPVSLSLFLILCLKYVCVNALPSIRKNKVGPHFQREISIKLPQNNQSVNIILLN